MGRTQAFDTSEVVRAARGVFWEQGFEGAPLPELERATGLSRSSIYHAFGSKRGLFDAAVENYLDEVIRPRLAPLKVDDVAPDALGVYLTGLRAALMTAGTQSATNGCLLVNTAAAPIAHDGSVAQVIASYRAELRDALGRGIRAHLPGTPAAEFDLLTDACTGLVVSAFALVRVTPDAAANAIDTARALIADHATVDV